MVRNSERSANIRANREQYPGLSYGISDIPPGLQRKSAQFRQYIRLQGLPENAPAFDLDTRDQPIVLTGEYVCRIEMPSKFALCGHRATCRHMLVEHIKKTHMIRPAGRVAGYDPESQHFYEKLMRDVPDPQEEDASQDDLDALPIERTAEDEEQKDDEPPSVQLITPAAKGPPPEVKEESPRRAAPVIIDMVSPEPEERPTARPTTTAARRHANAREATSLKREREEEVMQEERADEEDMEYELEQIKLQLRQRELEHELKKMRKAA